MEQEKYDLVFSGELMPEFELAQVKKSLQQLFRIDEAKVDALFSGRAIPLRKGLDAATAAKYRAAIESAGAKVAIVSCADVAVPAPAPVPAKAAVALTTELGAQPLSAPAPAKEIQAPDFGIAAVGSTMLPEAFQPKQPDVDIDLSAYSVAPQEGNLVRSDELSHLKVVDVIVPNLGIAEVGSDLLNAAERPKVQPVVVDTSALSVAPVGERLGPKVKEAPPPPNVDHLKLVQ